MKVGTQHGDSDAILRVLAGFGVNHICSLLPSRSLDAAWSVEGLTRLRERVESFGITLDMVPLPLSSSEISRSENPAILLGKDPERNKQIDDICQMIRNTARAGIPSAKYNLTLDRHSTHRADQGPRRRQLQHLCVCRREAGSAAHRGRPRQRRSVLGTHHLFPRTRRPGRRGIQGAARLPSAGSRHAEGQGLARRRDGAGIGRRA